MQDRVTWMVMCLFETLAELGLYECVDPNVDYKAYLKMRKRIRAYLHGD